jgi:hypothetical protein
VAAGPSRGLGHMQTKRRVLAHDNLHGARCVSPRKRRSPCLRRLGTTLIVFLLHSIVSCGRSPGSARRRADSRRRPDRADARKKMPRAGRVARSEMVCLCARSITDKYFITSALVLAVRPCGSTVGFRRQRSDPRSCRRTSDRAGWGQPARVGRQRNALGVRAGAWLPGDTLSEFVCWFALGGRLAPALLVIAAASVATNH